MTKLDNCFLSLYSMLNYSGEKYQNNCMFQLNSLCRKILVLFSIPGEYAEASL